MNESLKRMRLSDQVAQVLRCEVREGAAGEKIPGDKEIAERFSVSPVTAGQAVLSLVQDGLLVRKQGSGTYIAEKNIEAEQTATRAGEKHIAVLIDKDMGHPQLSYAHRRITETLLKFFQKHDLPVKRYTGRKAPWEFDGEPTCLEFLDAVKADKIKAVVSQATYPDPLWMQPLRQRNIPVVGGWGSDAVVRPDYIGMIKKAIDYLYKKGRRDIALMEWYGGWFEEQHRSAIHRTFESQMQKHGLEVKTQWIRRDLSASRPGSGWEGFREIWSSSSREKPDGLIVTDDILFRDAALAILEIGIAVPDDLMLVTQSNKNSGMFYPLPVARMEINPDDEAQLLGDITLRLLNGNSISDINKVANFHWVEAEVPYEPMTV